MKFFILLLLVFTLGCNSKNSTEVMTATEAQQAEDATESLKIRVLVEQAVANGEVIANSDNGPELQFVGRCSILPEYWGNGVYRMYSPCGGMWYYIPQYQVCVSVGGVNVWSCKGGGAKGTLVDNDSPN